MRTLTVSKNALESMLTTFIYCHPRLGHTCVASIQPDNMDRKLEVHAVETPGRVQKFRINSLKPDSFNPDKLCDQSFILADCSAGGTTKMIPGVLFPYDNTLLFPKRVLQTCSDSILNNPDLRIYIMSDILKMPHSPKCEVTLVEYYGQDLDWLTSGSGYVLQRIHREFVKPKKKENENQEGKSAF